MVKNPSASAGDTVRSLGREDPLEKEMATHPRILAGKIPRTEEPGGPTVHGITESRTRLSAHVVRMRLHEPGTQSGREMFDRLKNECAT